MAIGIVSGQEGGPGMPFPSISICLSEFQRVDGIAFLKSARKIVKCLLDGRVKIVHFSIKTENKNKDPSSQSLTPPF